MLLDTEDMVGMAEPDWKCVYTYIGEFYKRIRDLGLLWEKKHPIAFPSSFICWLLTTSTIDLIQVRLGACF